MNASLKADSQKRNLAEKLTPWVMRLEDYPGQVESLAKRTGPTSLPALPRQVEYPPEPGSPAHKALAEQLEEFLFQAFDTKVPWSSHSSLRELWEIVKDHLDPTETPR